MSVGKRMFRPLVLISIYRNVAFQSNDSKFYGDDLYVQTLKKVIMNQSIIDLDRISFTLFTILYIQKPRIFAS